MAGAMMHEFDEILVMLLVTGFFASAFWPVLCGWVDLGTLQGRVSLSSTYGNLVIGCIVLGLSIAIGNLMIALPVFLLHCIKDKASPERRAVIRHINVLQSIAYQGLECVWPCVGSWLSASLDGSRPQLKRHSPMPHNRELSAPLPYPRLAPPPPWRQGRATDNSWRAIERSLSTLPCLRGPDGKRLPWQQRQGVNQMKPEWP